MSHPKEKSVWISGLKTAIKLSDIAGFCGKIGEIHKVLDHPDREDSALVVFVNARSVQKALTLNETNMRDNVIYVTVPNESQLRCAVASPTTQSVDILKSEFGKLDPSIIRT